MVLTKVVFCWFPPVVFVFGETQKLDGLGLLLKLFRETIAKAKKTRKNKQQNQNSEEKGWAVVCLLVSLPQLVLCRLE